ncbi:hypothetical protein EOL96_02370 [Candidatus Saccharibacteria bacterium]|nr:hypothetical protein [Candidatus Saccharibacteria bacterium]
MDVNLLEFVEPEPGTPAAASFAQLGVLGNELLKAESVGDEHLISEYQQRLKEAIAAYATTYGFVFEH